MTKGTSDMSITLAVIWSKIQTERTHMYQCWRAVEIGLVSFFIHPTASSDHADLIRYTQLATVHHWFSTPACTIWTVVFLFYHQFYSILYYSQQTLCYDRKFWRNGAETGTTVVWHRNHGFPVLGYLPRFAPLSPSLPQATFSSPIHYIVNIIR